jgi:inner membrane protein
VGPLVPSIGHAIVGLAAARAYAPGPRLPRRTAATFTALAVLPDVDFLFRALAPHAGAAWLHRGASHSLAVAVLAGLLVAALGGRGRPRAAMALAAAATAASHGLLDTLTHGGPSVMLLWPWSTARLGAPFRLMPAAPLGLRLLSPGGLAVMGRELLVFSPLLAWLAWRWARGRAAKGLAPPGHPWAARTFGCRRPARALDPGTSRPVTTPRTKGST